MLHDKYNYGKEYKKKNNKTEINENLAKEFYSFIFFI